MTKFGIFDRYDAVIASIHADSVEAALDAYAQYRSGYDTFAEMRCSATFREAATVTVSPIA